MRGYFDSTVKDPFDHLIKQNVQKREKKTAECFFFREAAGEMGRSVVTIAACIEGGKKRL